MDNLNGEALFLEHLPECTREFLFSDDPPAGRSIGGFELAHRLIKQLVATLEVPKKFQLLIDPLRVARAFGLKENTLVEAIEIHFLVT
jgi:hypothetical protein